MWSALAGRAPTVANPLAKSKTRMNLRIRSPLFGVSGVVNVISGTSAGQANITFEALDVLYVPSRDVEADLNFYRDVLGARVVFAIEAMGTRVAEVETSSHGPRLV